MVKGILYFSNKEMLQYKYLNTHHQMLNISFHYFSFYLYNFHRDKFPIRFNAERINFLRFL